MYVKQMEILVYSLKNQTGLSCRLNSRYIGSRFEKDSFASLRPGINKSDYTTEGGYATKDKVLKHPDYLVFDLSLNYTSKSIITSVVLFPIFWTKTILKKMDTICLDGKSGLK